ncbi:MFS transporter [Lysinibacillus sp. UGB7]
MGLATSLYISSNALGGTIGRFVMGSVTERYSWETAFLSLALLGFIIFVIVCIALPKSKHFAQHARTIKKDLHGFWSHLNNPNLLKLFGLGLFYKYHLQECGLLFRFI